MTKKLEELHGEGHYTMAKDVYDTVYGDHSGMKQDNPIDYFKSGQQAANRAIDLLQSGLKPSKLVWGDLLPEAKKTLLRALRIAIPILEAELEEELQGPAPREYVEAAIKAELNRTRVLAASLKTSLLVGP
jgi:hypothetical protein